MNEQTKTIYTLNTKSKNQPLTISDQSQKLEIANAHELDIQSFIFKFLTRRIDGALWTVLKLSDSMFCFSSFEPVIWSKKRLIRDVQSYQQLVRLSFKVKASLFVYVIQRKTFNIMSNGEA